MIAVRLPYSPLIDVMFQHRSQTAVSAAMAFKPTKVINRIREGTYFTSRHKEREKTAFFFCFCGLFRAFIHSLSTHFREINPAVKNFVHFEQQQNMPEFL